MASHAIRRLKIATGLTALRGTYLENTTEITNGPADH